ncbi:helix-turn-helix transcriptional regulator [Pedobacter sp. PAMC26386]|nr:helix-turn-helix transcriptional regulator [Pedobacter sp. PAMC26386]
MRLEMMKNMTNIVGKKIKELRLRKQWSQEELADRLNTSMVTISRIEHSRIERSVYRMKKIAKLFEISYEDFFLDQSSSNQKQHEILELKAELIRKDQEIERLLKKIIELFEEMSQR